MKIRAGQINALHSERYRSTIFPGAARLANGDLVMLMVAGSDFESSDQCLVQARSLDNGKNWQFEDSLDGLAFPGLQPFSACAKPTLCADGSLVAGGYGFHRDKPEMGLSDYAEKFGRFPAMENFFITSTDQGRSWSQPWIMHHDYEGLELSGPILAMPDGELLMFAAPFALHAPRQKGLTFSSIDGGKTWCPCGNFFESESVAPWEVRSVLLPTGRIVLVIWAFDLVNSKHLNNHIIYSDDRGQSWSQPLDTSLRGQASNFLFHDGKLGVLQARREGDNPGIYLSDIEVSRDIVRVVDEICLLQANGMANSGGHIEEQFAALKFGQPSALALSDGAYLLIFWSMDATGTYSVKTQRFVFEE